MESKKTKFNSIVFLGFAAIFFIVFCFIFVSEEVNTAQAESTYTETALSGTSGAATSEGYANLFDKDLSTKWCFYTYNNGYVIWEISSAVSVSGYYIGTGNDNTTYNGRNPATWVLYGCNASSTPSKSSSDWVTIDSVTDDDVLEDVDQELYEYSCGTTAEYNYFKLEIKSAKDSKTCQLSEFSLIYDGCSTDFEHIGEAISSSSVYSDSVDMTIYMDVGDEKVLSNPYSSSGASFYAYTWYITYGEGTVTETHVKNSSSATITAVAAGTAQVTTYLDASYPVTNYGSVYNSNTHKWESYTYTTYSSSSYTYIYEIIVSGGSAATEDASGSGSDSGDSGSGSTENSADTNGNNESNSGSDTETTVSAVGGCGSISTGGGSKMFIISSALLVTSFIIILRKRKSAK